VGNREDAADLVQDVFGRAWQHWDTVSGHPNREGWCRTVLANLVASRGRRLRLQRLHTPAIPAADDGGSDHLDLDLSRSVSNLLANQREAFVLRVLLDLSTEAAAREMGVAPGTVRSLVHRARATLAAQLDLQPNQVATTSRRTRVRR
jgi:RNA polymerase sigma-70 factor (ECF subfamily)